MTGILNNTWFISSPFSAWCPLKGHIYLKNLHPKTAVFFKFALPFDGQALNPLVKSIITFLFVDPINYENLDRIKELKQPNLT